MKGAEGSRHSHSSHLAQVPLRKVGLKELWAFKWNRSFNSVA
jgi:hypothetical protein